MSIEWNDSLITGIRELDRYNKDFYLRLNSLIDAANRGKGQTELPNMMDFLEMYVNKYLPLQEEYMKNYGYIKHMQHCSVHNLFRQSFKVLNIEFKRGSTSSLLVLKINKLLINWLISHINTEDVEFTTFIRSVMSVKNNLDKKEQVL